MALFDGDYFQLPKNRKLYSVAWIFVRCSNRLNKTSLLLLRGLEQSSPPKPRGHWHLPFKSDWNSLTLCPIFFHSVLHTQCEKLMHENTGRWPIKIREAVNSKGKHDPHTFITFSIDQLAIEARRAFLKRRAKQCIEACAEVVGCCRLPSMSQWHHLCLAWFKENAAPPTRSWKETQKTEGRAFTHNASSFSFIYRFLKYSYITNIFRHLDSFWESIFFFWT